MTNDQRIRAQSLAWLAPRGFKVADWLPLSGGDFNQLRPVEQIAARAMAIKALFAFVVVPEQVLSGDYLTAFFTENNLRDALTGGEREILLLDREVARSQHQNTIGWKLENLWPLAWVLGFEETPTIKADQISSDIQNAVLHGFLPSFKTLVDEFVSQLTPRDAGEVAELEDLFYCAHNAVRSAQIGGDTVPEGFHPILHGGVVHERRHSLTWCLSPGIAWDETDLST